VQSFFSLRNERVRVSAGLGFSQRHFSMSKFNAGDFILLIIPFATLKDTAYLTKVRSTSQYINVPLGFEYRLSNNSNHRVTFFAGLRLINSFKISATTVATPDTVYFKPTSTQLSTIGNSYNNDINNYLLRIEPYLDMDIHFAKGYGMRMGLFPISFYVTPWSKKITQTATAIGVNFSLYKKLVAKK
jgi:Outer membrane protein beta-barrel domain